LNKAFDVFVRRKGKKVLIGSGLSFGRATRLGVAFTGQNIQRSFVVKESGFTTMSDVPLPSLYQYRVPKFGGQVAREGFKFVEKNKYAIDTSLEKQQLKAGRLSVFKPKAFRLK
jgi:hypothetical protein